MRKKREEGNRVRVGTSRKKDERTTVEERLGRTVLATLNTSKMYDRARS
jgi:hypothetical protein